MPGDVFRDQRRRRHIVAKGEVRFIARLKAAKAGVEVAIQQFIAVAQRLREAVRPQRPAGVAVFKEGKLHLLEHIGTDAVGTERQIADLRQAVVVADVVVHIGARVVHQETVLRIEQLHVSIGDVQTVSNQRFTVDKAELRQPRQQILAVKVMAVRDIVAVFRRVDMQAAAGGF